MKHKIKFSLVFFLFLLLITTIGSLYAPQISAQTPPPGTSYISLENPIRSTATIPELVRNIVDGILGIVGAIALLMFVYGGVLWLTSLGNAQRIEKGKDTLLWASIGLAVIFTSYAILTFVFKALTGE